MGTCTAHLEPILIQGAKERAEPMSHPLTSCQPARAGTSGHGQVLIRDIQCLSDPQNHRGSRRSLITAQVPGSPQRPTQSESLHVSQVPQVTAVTHTSGEGHTAEDDPGREAGNNGRARLSDSPTAYHLTLRLKNQISR